MINTQTYIPFLKLKQNEIMALKELTGPCRGNLLPFFDFPMGMHDNLSKFQDYAKARAKQIRTHIGDNFRCYIDDYDANEFLIGAHHSYFVLLNEFANCSPIPVTGIDRTDDHKQSILDAISSGVITSDSFAFRIQLEDIHSYNAIEDEITESLSELMDVFQSIDLIIDLRVTLNHDVNTTSSNISVFVDRFLQNFPVNKVIITGSSIPSIVTNVCPPQSRRTFSRKEVEIFSAVKHTYRLDPQLVIGDYTVVSPEYSDISIQAELMRSVMTSKLIYSHNRSHTVWRGTSLRMEGEKQYNEHAADLVSLPIYRGSTYSWADGEFFTKSTLLSGFSASSMVKHTINAHVEFMIMTGI